MKPAAVQAARAAVTVDPTRFGTFLQLGVGAGVGVGLGVALGVGVGVGAGVAVGGGVGPDLPAGVAVAVGGSGVAPSVVAAGSVDVGTELDSWDAVAPPDGAADGEPVASDAALAITARAGVGVASVDPAVDPSGPPKARPSSARATTSVPIASGARMSGRRPTVDGPALATTAPVDGPPAPASDRARHDGRRNLGVVRRPDGQHGGRRVADATARAGAIPVGPAPATGVDLADHAMAEPDLGADGVLVDGPAAALAHRPGWLASGQRRIRRAQHGASMSNARGLGWAVRRDRAITGRENTARHNLGRAVSDSGRGPKLGLRSSSCDPETYGWMSRLKPPLSWRPGRAAGKAG